MSVTSQVSNVRNENYYGFGVKGFHTKMKKKKKNCSNKVCIGTCFILAEEDKCVRIVRHQDILEMVFTSISSKRFLYRLRPYIEVYVINNQTFP